MLDFAAALFCVNPFLVSTLHLKRLLRRKKELIDVWNYYLRFAEFVTEHASQISPLITYFVKKRVSLQGCNFKCFRKGTANSFKLAFINLNLKHV